MKRSKEQFKKLFPSDMRKYSREQKDYDNHWNHRKIDWFCLNTNITPQMKQGIDLLIKAGKFSNRCEFVRYLIIKYFDERCNNERT